MAEQDGNALHRDTGQRQLDSERVPETVRMTTRNFRESKKFFQAPLPVSHGALELPLAAAEKILPACAAHRLESLDHRIGKRAPNRSAGLGRVEKELAIRDPLILAGVVLAMALLGLLATWIPAQRALSVDPSILLREE